MPTLELQFPVIGGTLPTDHAYPLYAALSRFVPALHDGQMPGLAIGPIGGTYMDGRNVPLGKAAPRSLNGSHRPRRPASRSPRVRIQEQVWRRPTRPADPRICS